MNKETVPIAFIYWHDAAMVGHEQLTAEEAENQQLIRGWVCGIIVKETDEYITLAMDWFDTGAYRQLHVYPKSGIEFIQKMDWKPVKSKRGRKLKK